jgi:hypothetical protein
MGLDLGALNPFQVVTKIGEKVVDHFFPDPTIAAQKKFEMVQLLQQGELQQMIGQMEINKVEAANPNMFVAGWRPFIGWVGGTSLAFNFIVGPLTAQVSQFTRHPIMYVPIDLTTMMPIILGMLGLGAYRTYEKVNDAEGNRS